MSARHARPYVLAASLAALGIALLAGCANGGDAATSSLHDPNPDAEVQYTDAEWRERLTEQEFYVLRQAGTERAGSGDLLHNDTAGVYTCAGCGRELFSSETKFDSGTGWPSFWQPIGGPDSQRIRDVRDSSFGITRIENRCGRCDSHLGHVFQDGPEPTGLRYCMNSVALNFIPAEAREGERAEDAAKDAAQ